MSPPGVGAKVEVFGSTVLLSFAFAMYKKDVITFRNQSRKTEEHHDATLKSLQNFLGGDIDVRELTFGDVREWKRAMADGRKPFSHPLENETIRGYLTKLRVVLDYLNRHGVECLDPETIHLPKRILKIPKIITPEEVTLLIDSCTSIRDKAIISLLYSTGLRVESFCMLDRETIEKEYFTVSTKGGALQPCYVDERSRNLINQYLETRRGFVDLSITYKILEFCSVPRQQREILAFINHSYNSKNRSKFIAPLYKQGCLKRSHKTFYDLNGKYKHHTLFYYQATGVMPHRRKLDGDGHPALFLTREGYRIRPMHIQELFKRIRVKAGFSWPVHAHTIRHTYLTNLMMNKAPLHAVQRLAGHKNISTTSIYLHIFDYELLEVHRKYHSIESRPV